MLATIANALQEIEQENSVHIFFACESGSRAWGFPSQNSDYDVRFLYIHPQDWYLSIDDKRDVIEKADGILDLSGWELRKALRLFRKSNPPLLEWLQSPMVYREKFTITDKLRRLLPEYYSPIACFHHYLHMARGNFREYLKGDIVWVKKYFYVLRPVLACIWIAENKGPVPMEFKNLVEGCITSSEVKTAVYDLIAKKLHGDELDRAPRIDILSQYIENELCLLESQQFDKGLEKPGTEKLDSLFRDALGEIKNLQ